MLSVFCSPARYVQGREATRFLASELQRLGFVGKALIIASHSPREVLFPVWQTTFSVCELTFEILDFGGECSFSEIARGKDEARRVGASLIIGVGGGKVLDTARAVASELCLPIACCPTTASSDAPCSALSVVYTEKGVFEKCLYYRRNPDLVLVDTSVIAKAPVRLLISGMGDALATYFEAEASIRAHKKNVVGGASTLAAATISELCYRTLLKDGVAAVAAARAGVVTPAFERIVEANTLLSGLGFESAGLAVAHSVHNGLTAAPETHDRLHGEKVAFGTLVQLVLEGRDSGLLNEVLGFCLSVGLPTTLAELGLEAMSMEQARAIAERAVAEGESAHNEPFEVTAQMVMDAMFAADSLAKSVKAGECV
ncbi:glycerol dehydrogenase [Methylocystis sp. WRRC1]|uniref:glycerol dehydrogenase n=1 Tax=Methylocystis sp. WRRC1 TaxID=1732014 RepID=UPI001D157661|nr:glycerol dehydrogenase [Methylocystis sp. WRRC1]MCC3244423.1 glycerol dehydrogenase [Methylocystis sp. WRRC1]